MNDERQELSDLIEAGPREPTVQITLEEDRPELVACLDGMQFRAGEDALCLFLQAAIKKLISEIQMDLHEEADLSRSSVELEARAVRLRLAARALRRELEIQGPPPPDGERSSVYRAETLELLHGPPPPIRLARPELETVIRMAKASLEDEAEQKRDDAASRRQELQVLLEDLTLVRKTDFPYLVTKLPMPRFLAWLDRWFHHLYGKKPDASSDVEVLRGLRRRIEQDWINQDDAGAGEGIFPRPMM